MKKTVVELFAGVGGFRVGLNDIKINSYGQTIDNGLFEFVWANQWEPSTKIQHAYDCYVNHFGNENVSNVDIAQVNKKDIPSHTLLVGGFPCQDYSVARSLSKEKGIEGKKGVLWWQINDILKEKKPPFVLLENVDRLIKSPSKQRGRDFGIMLRCFDDLGYAVEWRVINAADYGHPQRRRRIYIFAYNKNTNYFKNQKTHSFIDVINHTGIFAKAFKIYENTLTDVKISNISEKIFNDLINLSNNYKFAFENSGYLLDGVIYTVKSQPIISDIKPLSEILQKESVDKQYYLSQSIEKLAYLKGSKKILREKNGVNYFYSEGAMSFPDDLDKPGRTMLTSEGSVNRSTHVVKDVTGKLRILTPVEAERLNEFPDNWTNTGMPIKRRYFMMGNALVTGLVNKLGNEISNIIDNEKGE